TYTSCNLVTIASPHLTTYLSLPFFFFLYPFLFFFNDTPPTEIYTLSLHDALPISDGGLHGAGDAARRQEISRHLVELEVALVDRSEEHTSELQSRENLVCRLLLEKKKKKKEKKYMR